MQAIFLFLLAPAAHLTRASLFLSETTSFFSTWASGTETTRAAETAGTANRILELLDNGHISHDALLDDELGDAVVLLDLEVGVGQVGQDDADRAAVVGIDNAGEGVNAVLVGETGTGGDAAV